MTHSSKIDCSAKGCQRNLEFGGAEGWPAVMSQKELLEMSASAVGWQQTPTGQWLCRDHKR